MWRMGRIAEQVGEENDALKYWRKAANLGHLVTNIYILDLHFSVRS